MSRIVVGVDLCKGSWAAVRLADGTFEDAAVIKSLEDLASGFGREAQVIAVDIPLSFPPPHEKGRACEREGRRLLGARAASMFDTYPEAVLAEATHAAANARAMEAVGCGIPLQSFSLGPAIRQGIAAREKDPRFHETHPELVFWNLAGALAPKKSWTGFRQRLQALEGASVRLPIDLPQMDRAAMDDVIDAAAAAWVADQILLGLAKRVPATGEGFPIWY